MTRPAGKDPALHAQDEMAKIRAGRPGAAAVGGRGRPRRLVARHAGPIVCGAAPRWWDAVAAGAPRPPGAPELLVSDLPAVCSREHTAGRSETRSSGAP